MTNLEVRINEMMATMDTMEKVLETREQELDTMEDDIETLYGHYAEMIENVKAIEARVAKYEENVDNLINKG